MVSSCASIQLVILGAIAMKCAASAAPLNMPTFDSYALHATYYGNRTTASGSIEYDLEDYYVWKEPGVAVMRSSAKLIRSNYGTMNTQDYFFAAPVGEGLLDYYNSSTGVESPECTFAYVNATNECAFYALALNFTAEFVKAHNVQCVAIDATQMNCTAKIVNPSYSPNSVATWHSLWQRGRSGAFDTLTSAATWIAFGGSYGGGVYVPFNVTSLTGLSSSSGSAWPASFPPNPPSKAAESACTAKAPSCVWPRATNFSAYRMHDTSFYGLTNANLADAAGSMIFMCAHGPSGPNPALLLSTYAAQSNGAVSTYLRCNKGDCAGTYGQQFFLGVILVNAPGDPFNGTDCGDLSLPGGSGYWLSTPGLAFKGASGGVVSSDLTAARQKSVSVGCLIKQGIFTNCMAPSGANYTRLGEQLEAAIAVCPDVPPPSAAASVAVDERMNARVNEFLSERGVLARSNHLHSNARGVGKRVAAALIEASAQHEAKSSNTGLIQLVRSKKGE